MSTTTSSQQPRVHLFRAIIGVVVLLVVVALLPSVARADVNPMVGSWEGVDADGDRLRLQIGGDGSFHWQEQSAHTGAWCGAFITVQGKGTFVGNQLIGHGEIYCHSRGEGGRTLAPFTIDPLVFTLNGDTITDFEGSGSTLHRTGQ